MKRAILDVWLKFDYEYDDEYASHEANTYETDDGFVIEWYHNDVGLVTRVYFDTLEEVYGWYAREGFEDFSS